MDGETAISLDVAVIGAGVFGAWCAAMLQRRGASVALIDAYGAAHARASSGGESRIIRLSYGGDALYSEMALESLAEWRALSARSAPPIYHEMGVLWVSRRDDAYMGKSLEWLAARGLAHRALDATALREAFPQMRFSDAESGFVEHGAGALMAARAVQTLLASHGIAPLRAVAAAPATPAATYEPAPGVRARSLIFACGPWLAKLFPAILEGRFFVTRQEVLHFGAPAGEARFASPALPVWGDFKPGDLVYGFPDLEGQGFKIAFDRHGPPIDPDTAERRVSDAAVAAARAYLARRFPDLADAPFLHGRVCQYENSADGDFLIDRLPGFDNVWLVGCGSGHGFKHGPAVGRRVADHVLDRSKPVEPRFSLAAKTQTLRRAVF